MGFSLTTEQRVFAGRNAERQLKAAWIFNSALKLFYKKCLWAYGTESYEKGPLLRIKVPGLSQELQFFANLHGKLHSSHNILKKVFSWTNKHSFKQKVRLILYFSFPDLILDSKRFQRFNEIKNFWNCFHKCFKPENNENELSDNQNTSNVLSEFPWYNFLLKELCLCHNYLLPCCIASVLLELLLYIKILKRCLSAAAGSLCDRKHWLIFFPDQSSEIYSLETADIVANPYIRLKNFCM